MNRFSRLLQSMADMVAPLEDPIEWPEEARIANWKVCYRDWKGQYQTRFVWDIKELRKVSRYAFAHVRRQGPVFLYVRTGPDMGDNSWTLVYKDYKKRGNQQ